MNEQMRKDFEAWYGRNFHPAALQEKENGHYLNLVASVAWDAWRAATQVERARCAEMCDTAGATKDIDAGVESIMRGARFVVKNSKA